MIEYRKNECDKCKSINTKTEVWEDEYSKYSVFTCLNCGYVVGKLIHKVKVKEALL